MIIKLGKIRAESLFSSHNPLNSLIETVLFWRSINGLVNLAHFNLTRFYSQPICGDRDFYYENSVVIRVAIINFNFMYRRTIQAKIF